MNKHARHCGTFNNANTNANVPHAKSIMYRNYKKLLFNDIYIGCRRIQRGCRTFTHAYTHKCALASTYIQTLLQQLLWCAGAKSSLDSGHNHHINTHTHTYMNICEIARRSVWKSSALAKIACNNDGVLMMVHGENSNKNCTAGRVYVASWS